jgi:TolA-binding protein
MHEKEIQYFTEAFQLAQDKFYVDAMHKFNKLVDEFPESDLADDALLNVGLCYYEMNQFAQAIEILEYVIELHPEATISVIGGGNEFGRTAGKAYYLIVQCYIGLGDIKKAESYIPILKNYPKTYIKNEHGKITFAKLAEESIKTFNSITNK